MSSTPNMKKQIYRHLRINKDQIHQYFDAYHPYSEFMLKRVPNKYWKDDLPKDNGIRITNIFIDETL